MSAQSVFRDLTLLAAAAAIGWWAHGANAPVLAQHGGSSDSNLAFQYGGLGPDGQLSLYNPNTRMLYIYPSIARSSNAQISCLYRVHIDSAGGALDRQPCAAGSFVPH